MRAVWSPVLQVEVFDQSLLHRECYFAFERKRKADELAVKLADPDFLPSIHREMEAALAKLASVVIPELPDLDDAEVTT